MTVWIVSLCMFRARDLAQAISFLFAMAGLQQPSASPFQAKMLLNSELCIGLALAALFSMPPQLFRSALGGIGGGLAFLAPSKRAAALALGRVALSTSIFALCILEIAAGTYKAFVYFRF